MIAKRLNQKPVGLGNSDSTIEMDSYMTGHGGKTGDKKTETGSDVEVEEHGDADKGLDDDNNFFTDCQVANCSTSTEQDGLTTHALSPKAPALSTSMNKKLLLNKVH